MAISLNGTSQYVTVANANACPVSGDGFWLSAWVKKNGAPAAEGLVVGWSEDGVNDSVCGIRMNTSGYLGSASKPDNAGALVKDFPALNCADNNWHCVTIWYEPSILTLWTMVDQIATATSRTLTAGQTFNLTRIFAGVQIRSGVDASLYWGGEIAEVAFGRGVITEGQARSIYNIGIPKRAQYPSSMYRRWSFQTDATASGGAGPDMTATGSPTYNSNDDALFDAIDAYTATALSDTSAALVVEGSLDSGTSHYLRVTTPSAGHIVVGSVWNLTDGVSSGQNVTQWAPFLAPENRGTSDPFANKLSDYVENQFRYITVPEAGDWMFRVFQTAGSTHVLRGVSVRFSSTYGGVPMYGNNFHCWPTAIDTQWGYFTYQRGLDSRATQLVQDDGTVVFNSDATARVDGGDDTYHSGGALVEMSTGMALVSVGHNSGMEIAYAASGAFNNSLTWHWVSQTGDNTYAVALADSSDVVHILNRGTNDASNGYHAQRWMVTSLASGSPTITVDHLGGDGTRQYPNTAYRVGDLIGYAWNGAWNTGFAAVFDVAGNKWYDFAKTQRGGNSLGTIATPRFTNTEWTTSMEAGTGLQINTSLNTIYQSSALFDLSNWATTGAKGGFLYSETAGALNEFAATTINWIVQSGATQYVGGVDFSVPAEWTCNYWRVFSAVRWLDDDPTTNTAILFIIDHDDRDAGGNYDTALPTGYTPYYDMGGRRVRVYKITDPLSSSPSFSLVSSPSVTTPTLTAGFVRTVPGKLNTFRWQEATTELHEVKRQGFEYEWEYVPSTNSIVSTGFASSLGLGV